MNIEKQKIKIVVDSNIVISALNFGGKPANVIFLAQIGIVELYLSEFILSEIAGVLVQKFKWQNSKAKNALRLLQEFSHIMMPIERIFVLKDDEADNRILECAFAAQADYIISGDKHLLRLKQYQNIEIIKAEQFLEKIRNN